MRKVLALLLLLTLPSSAIFVWGVKKQAVETGVSVQGLTFPSNTTEAPRFKFTSTNLVNFYPATYIWRVRPTQQTGYYTTFFWGPDGAFTGTGYYGAHPYPDGDPPASGTTHKWEISVNGQDDVTDENAYSTAVAQDAWKIQALRVRASGSDMVLDFYWDLGAGTDRVISHTAASYLTPAGSPALTWGGAPWATNTENLSGELRGIQIYSTNLDLADIVTEAANHTVNTPQTAAGIANVWYMNQSPTPDDITDKSGEGHDPEWVDAGNKATLWTD